MQFAPLSKGLKITGSLLALMVVSFGQPAWSPALGFVASIVGFALFWRVLLDYSEPRRRFLLGTLWFAVVQLIQLSWFISHPYGYIYVLWVFFALALGLQFGLLCLMITSERLRSVYNLLAIAGIWTLMEWSRLFFLSGYTWNPVGLALASNSYALQAASLVGVYGLSFWVVLVNLLTLRLWASGILWRPAMVWLTLAALPYAYGVTHIWAHERNMSRQQTPERFRALLVQTSFPVEETLSCFRSKEELVDFVSGEWEKILHILRKHYGKSVSLIALPELVVPFNAYTFLFPYEKVEQAFVETFGEASRDALPAKQLPLAHSDGSQWMVNHAFWLQTIANLFDASIVSGMEDAADVDGHREYYSAALYVEPKEPFTASRYAKRVLVPMGEYIPFTFCQEWAAAYGVSGSFTPGQKAVVWDCKGVPFGVSICYEETFGDLMRESRQEGAKILVNLTSDVWYPHSKLVLQHLEHARLRTVENGIPLLRACNTGVTCAVDAFGRDRFILGEDAQTREDVADALYVDLPLYDYQTLYSQVGDGIVIGFSLLAVLLFFRLNKKGPPR